MFTNYIQTDQQKDIEMNTGGGQKKRLKCSQIIYNRIMDFFQSEKKIFLNVKILIDHFSNTLIKHQSKHLKNI